MAFSQLQILVTSGGAQQNVVIAIPPAASTDAFDQPPGATAQQKPGIAAVVLSIARTGFWDSAGAVYYPPASILRITPS